MSGRFLSSKELLQSIKDQHHFEITPKCGSKDNTYISSIIQKQKLVEFFQHRFLVLYQECIKKKNKLAIGNYIEDVGQIQLIKIIGKFWQNMGCRINGNDCLYPEEAMFLIHQGLLLVNRQGLIMSAEEAFFTLLDSHKLQLEYQLFSHLTTYGYILKNYKLLNTSKKYKLKKENRKEICPESFNHKKKFQKIDKNNIFEFKKVVFLNEDIISDCDIINQEYIFKTKAFEKSAQYIVYNSENHNFNNLLNVDPICKNNQFNDINLFKNIDIDKLVYNYLKADFTNYNCCINYSEILDNENLFKSDELYSYIVNLNLASICIILHKTSKRTVSINPILDISLLPPNIIFSKVKYEFEFSFNVKDEYREIVLSLEDIINNTRVITKNEDNLLDNFTCDNLFPNCFIDVYMLKNITNFEINIDIDIFLKIEKILQDPNLLNQIKIKMSNKDVAKEHISPLIHHPISFSNCYEKLNIINHITQCQQFGIESNKHSKIRKSKMNYNLYYPNKKFKKSNPGEPTSRIFVQSCSDVPLDYNNLKNLHNQSSQINYLKKKKVPTATLR